MKNNLSITLKLSILLIVIFSGCNYDVVVPAATEVLDEEVSFSEDIQPIFNQSCATVGCHNQGGIAPVLEAGKSYDALISGNYINTADSKTSELYLWMIGERSISMPLSGPDADYNAYILSWIEQGAKNN